MAKQDKAKQGKKAQKRGPGKADARLAQAASRIEELTVEVAALRDQVEGLEADVLKWRRKADKHRSRAKKLRTTAEKALAEAAHAARKRAKSKAAAKAAARQVIADHPRAEPLALRDAPRLPEASWTVTQLRAAARDQGVAGYSRLRKDQLLDVLI